MRVHSITCCLLPPCLGFSRFQWRRGACSRRRGQRRDDEPRGCQHDIGCIGRWNGRASLAHHSETQALVHDAGVQRCDCGYGFHLCRSQHRLSMGGVDDWPHRRFCVRFNTLHLLALSSSINALLFCLSTWSIAPFLRTAIAPASTRLRNSTYGAQ